MGNFKAMANSYKVLIIETWVNNPDLSYRELAKLFKTNEWMVSKILNAYTGSRDWPGVTILSKWETD